MTMRTTKDRLAEITKWVRQNPWSLEYSSKDELVNLVEVAQELIGKDKAIDALRDDIHSISQALGFKYLTPKNKIIDRILELRGKSE